MKILNNPIRQMIKYLSLILLIAFGGSLYGQKKLSGRVTDGETGDPLVGVNIQIKNSNYGVVTDKDGYYELLLPASGEQFFSRKSPPPILVFSYTGFSTREVVAPESNRLNVDLREVAAPLEEVVVSGAAVGRSPQLMTYAVGRVDGGALNTAPGLTFGDGLRGRVPGLRVSRPGGQPGQEVYFQIRSANSLANGQQPLIIVDGIFLTSGSLADINVEDIERVEILKGPAGAALYGSQAANGVVQVFTRRGRELETGTTQVVYRNEVGVSDVAGRYPVNTMTNREIIEANGPQPILGNPTAGNTYAQELPNLQDYQESALFQRGLLQSHGLSVQSKTAATNFRTSYQWLRDEGVLQGIDGYSRHAFRLNLDHQLNDKFDLQLSSAYSQSARELIDPVANGPENLLAGMLFFTPMFSLEAPNEEDGTAYDWDIDNTGANITNPLYAREHINYRIDRDRFMAGATANYFARDWLTFTYTAALDRSMSHWQQYVEKGYLSTSVPARFGTLTTAGVQGSQGGGILMREQNEQYFVSRANVVLQKQMTGFHLATRLGVLYEDWRQAATESRGEDLAVRDLRSLDNARANLSITSDEQEVVAYSGFAVADVHYKEKYLFSGLIRREGSSLFGPEQRWANYYRVSGAYRLTQDIPLKPFRELKLRASLGTAGLRPTYEQRFETFALVNGQLTKQTLGNTMLRPALATERELGVDAVIGRAIRLEFNYSDITTEDQILLVPLSAAAGFRGQWRNAGTVEARTYEASLGIDIARLFNFPGSDFRWYLRSTFDRTQQTITQLDVPDYFTGPGAQQASLFLIGEGQPLGTLVGEVFATELSQLQDQEGVDPSDYVLNDLGYVVRADQLGTPDEAPYKLRDAGGNPLVQTIGNIQPDFRMGISHTLAYKGLELFTLFDWKKGGDVYNATKQWLFRDGRHAEVSADPDISAGFYGSNGLYNSLVANNHFVEDGSFFMLREAALSWQIEKKGLGGFFGKFDHIRLSLIGRNLFTISDYSGFHPDISSVPRNESLLTTAAPDARGSDLTTPNGDPNIFLVDSFNYPLRRTLTFSLQVGF